MGELKSIEEVEITSKITTQDELINLGRQLQKKDTDDKLKIEEYNNIIKNILEFNNINEYWINKLKTHNQFHMFRSDDGFNNFINILTNIPKYIELSEYYITNNLKEIEQLKEDKSELDEQLENEIEENEEKDKLIKQLKNDITLLETKINDYWKPRVEKLRNKCICKNNSISFLKKGLFISSFFTMILTTYFITKYNIPHDIIIFYGIQIMFVLFVILLTYVLCKFIGLY